MAQSASAEARLAGHYAALGDIRGDFRNVNLNALLAGMVRGSRVLDIGCGTGALLALLQQAGKEVLGLEPSDALRAQAAQHHPTVHILAGEAEEVAALVTQPADSILMVDVLEHIEGDAAQVARVAQVLAPGGQFIVVVPQHQWLYGQRDKQMGHFRRYTRNSLQRVLEQNGFRVTYMRSWNMLGVLPYLVSERILHKPFDTKLREGSHGTIGKTLQTLLFLWCKYIENPINWGFGLSLIAVATKQ